MSGNSMAGFDECCTWLSISHFFELRSVWWNADRVHSHRACVWLSSSCILTTPLRQLRELIDLLFDDCMLMSRSVALRRDVTHVPLETLHPFRSSRFERRCCCLFFLFFCLNSTQTHLLRCSRYFSSRQKPVSRVYNLATVARFLWEVFLLWQMVLQWSGSDTGSVEIFAER